VANPGSGFGDGSLAGPLHDHAVTAILGHISSQGVKEMANVFISYSQEDKDRIKPIVEGLRSIGLSVWSDARSGTGSQWEKVIESELGAARVILVCWSQVAVRSKCVKTEANFARDQGTLISCLLEPFKLPPLFEFNQAADISNWTGATDHLGWRKIVDRISVLLERPGLTLLLDARATGDPRQLLSWAQTFPDDPYAIEIFKFFETSERQRFDEEMRSTRDAISASVKSLYGVLQARLADCVKAFEGWIADVKTASYDARPDPTDLLATMESPMAAAAMRKLEAERDAGNERASRLEAAYEVAGAENKSLTEKSPTLPHSWGSMLVSCLVGVAAGLGGYRIFMDTGSTSAETVKQLSQRLDTANAELRVVRDQLRLVRDERDKGVLRTEKRSAPEPKSTSSPSAAAAPPETAPAYNYVPQTPVLRVPPKEIRAHAHPEWKPLKMGSREFNEIQDSCSTLPSAQVSECWYQEREAYDWAVANRSKFRKDIQN
jgi:hypothetical protein